MGKKYVGLVVFFPAAIRARHSTSQSHAHTQTREKNVMTATVGWKILSGPPPKAYLWAERGKITTCGRCFRCHGENGRERWENPERTHSIPFHLA
jgi:hypothetical protein